MLNYNGSHNFLRFPGFKYKALTLSYDDGLKSDKRLIDIMLKYGLKGTFNLNSGFMLDGVNPDKILLPGEAFELYTSSGMEVAVHGSFHLPVDKVPPETAVNDLIKDRVALEKLFKKVIKGMAYPIGTLDDESPSIVEKCGIKYARTIKLTENFELPDNWLKWDPTTRNISPNFMRLAEEFLSLAENKYFWFNEPKLFFGWGHSFEFYKEEHWEFIENFAKLVGGKDDIWYATNGEIFDYVKAFDRLEFSCDGTLVHNPSSIDVYIKYIGNKEVVVPAGKTVDLR